MVSARRARIVRKLAKPRNVVYTFQLPPIPLQRTAEQITSRLARQRWDG